MLTRAQYASLAKKVRVVVPPFTWESLTPDECVAVTDRFWGKVSTGDGCWLWIGARFKNQYGALAWKGQKRKAHRLSWFIHFGPIPVGLHVCHTCDNPPCVRPDHLFLGTHADNMRDCEQKNRRPHPAGEAHPRARLTAAAVLEARELVRSGRATIAELSQRHGVAPQTIRSAVYGPNWSTAC